MIFIYVISGASRIGWIADWSLICGSRQLAFDCRAPHENPCWVSFSLRPRGTTSSFIYLQLFDNIKFINNKIKSNYRIQTSLQIFIFYFQMSLKTRLELAFQAPSLRQRADLTARALSENSSKEIHPHFVDLIDQFWIEI